MALGDLVTPPSSIAIARREADVATGASGAAHYSTNPEAAADHPFRVEGNVMIFIMSAIRLTCVTGMTRS